MSITRTRSTQAAATFADKSIDILHVDGNHSLAGVMADVRAWLPRVARGGLLIMDDAGWFENGVATVKQAIAFLVANGCKIEFSGDYVVLRKS